MIIYKFSYLFRYIRQIYFKNINKLLLWSAGVNYGVNLRIYNRFYLKKYPGSQMKIGDNFIFTSGEAINPIARNIRGCIFLNNNSVLNIGNNVGISSSCIWCDKNIVIGDNVKIGACTTILDTDCHSLYYLDRRITKSDKNNTIRKAVIIEDDVLIGAHSIILKGVTIGKKTIIGAGSVVTKDIPANCIAAGNPCKAIKYINEIYK